MKPDRWESAKRLFHDALERPPAERDRFVREAAAGDTELRDEVIAMLTAHTRADEAFRNVGRSGASEILQPGTRLGPYEIHHLIGVGGMGEVYHARDPRLRRDVAIKTLPASLADDAERLRRFEREAQLLAALNHPHIAAIYGVEEATVSTATRPTVVHALVLELVEGPTLADRIAGGPLPIPDALAIAGQIADALDAAHERGIVHRDLKPANVKLTPDGAVKVLDFGLAKMEPTASDLTESPTITAIATREGVIAGTAPYMSPEQARGKAVDKRADIWAFGCVLYELLTGTRAFSGDTTTDVLASVVNRDPNWKLLPRATPEGIRRLLIRCLEKDPKRRLRDIGEARVEIDDARAARASSYRASVGRLALVLAAIVLAAGVAVALMWSLNRAIELPRPVLTRLTSDSGLTVDPTLSPDGALLAYASDRSAEGHLDIWVQQIAGGEPVRLTRHPTDDREPSFSPDGTKIVFRSDRDGGGIYVVSALGGEARLIARDGRQPRFSPDGSSIAYWAGILFGDAHLGTIHIVPASGGVPLQLEMAGTSTAYNPVWSPDGMKLLIQAVAGPNPYAEASDWWVASPFEGSPRDAPIRTGARDLLRQHGLSGTNPSAWIAEGNQVVFSATSGDTTNLWQISLSPQTGQVTGAPTQLTFGAGVESQASVVSVPGSARIAVSRRLVFSVLNQNVDLWALPVDTSRGKAAAQLQRLTQDANLDLYPAISSEGKTLVYASRRSGSFDIWRKDLESGVESPVTTTPWQEARPALTADGARVAYEMVREQRRSCQAVALGPGPGGGAPLPAVPRALPDNCWRPWSWSSSGTKLLYLVIDKPNRVDLLDVVSGETKTLLRSPKLAVYQAYFSPDDRWVAFIATPTPTRTSRVFVAAYREEGTSGEDSWIGITDGTNWDDKPRWSPDGKRIYFTSDRDGFQCIWAQDLDPVTKRPVRSPFAVYHSHSARLSMMNVRVDAIEISVSTDRLVFPMGEITGNIWMAEVPDTR